MNRSVTSLSKASKALPLLLACHLMLLPASCTQDTYEKGEGTYSLMRGDFAEGYVNTDRAMISITTDDGDLLPLKEPYKDQWITSADTTYRCMLYYNKVEGSNGQPMADVISMGPVPCPSIRRMADMRDEFRTDPVKFESAWMSRSMRYLNMSIQVKTGITDDTAAVQRLSIVADTLIRYADHSSSLYLLLHHNQGGVPEYYSTTAYVSLPVDSIPADTVHLTINSYDGLVHKQFVMHRPASK